MTYEQIHDKILSLLLWTFGGTLYFFCEVFWKTVVSDKPESISWTMLALAMFLCIPLERFGSELPWEMPLWKQSVICTTMITVSEFFVGVLLNIVLKMNVWDYSEFSGNVLGQICPQFTFIWLIFSFVAIVIFDWIRYYITGGDKPRYKLF